MTPTPPTAEEVAELEALMEDVKDQQERANALQADNPGLHHITAFIMAGDIRSGERAYDRVVAGQWDVEQALTFTGSYARLALADKLYENGYLPRTKYHRMLPDLWRGSDPDDTDPRWLRLWKQARGRKGRLIHDGKQLPKRGRVNGALLVYRGQPESAPLGIAWTTDKKIAEKFASGAGARVPTPGGVVIVGHVHPDSVIAYLTERGESEVIVDPLFVTIDHHLTGDTDA